MDKLLVIGFDGATFDLIRPLTENGRLPTLAHLMQHGAWGTLTSTIPPITPTAWSTVFTGKNPGMHGIYDFLELDPATYQRQPVYTDRHQEKTVWDLLSEAGLPSIITDVPYTYPPRPLNGLMLTGYGTPRTPGTRFTFPDAWQSVLPNSLHETVAVAQPVHAFDRSQAFLDEWQQIMNGRLRLLRHLITEQAWSLFFHVFSITDNLAHVFWTYLEPSHPNYGRSEAPAYREALFDAYVQCDRILGDLLETAAPVNVIVMSDHGFGSVYPRQYLFQRLTNAGYTAYQTQGGRGDRLLKLAMRLYTQFPFLREWVKNLRPNSQQALKAGLTRSGLLPGSNPIDYANSRVIPSDFGLQLWLNHRQRFAHGLLDAADTAVLAHQLITFLLDDRDKATGQPIIRQVYTGSEQYTGPFAPLGPDLIIEYRNFYQPDAPPTGNNPFLEGGHTHDGVFIGHGPAFRAAAIDTPMSLTDLAPTMLHLLGQPVPPDMNGRVLTETLTPAFLTKQPVRHGQTPARFAEANGRSQLTAAQEAELADQLRRLGYVD